MALLASFLMIKGILLLNFTGLNSLLVTIIFMLPFLFLAVVGMVTLYRNVFDLPVTTQSTNRLHNVTLDVLVARLFVNSNTKELLCLNFSKLVAHYFSIISVVIINRCFLDDGRVMWSFQCLDTCDIDTIEMVDRDWRHLSHVYDGLLVKLLPVTIQKKLSAFNISDQGLCLPFHSSSSLESLIVFSPPVGEVSFSEEVIKKLDQLSKLALMSFDRLNKQQSVNFELSNTSNQSSYSKFALLTRGVVHEIKSPIGHMINIIDYLKRSFETHDPIHNRLHLLDRTMTRFRHVISKLTDYDSSVSSDQTVFELSHIVCDVMDFLQEPIHARKMVLQTSFESSKLVFADSNFVSQAILNVLSNAIIYSPIGSTITLRLSESTYLNETGCLNNGLCLVVSDNGPGMTRDQIDQSLNCDFSKRPQKDLHMGLGLPFSKQVFIKNNGNMVIDNNIDGGLDVKMYLPLS